MLRIVVYILAGLLVLVIVVVFISNIMLNKKISESVNRLIESVNTGTPVKKFAYTDLEGLPAPVQDYFSNVLPEGRQYINFARLKQEGEMKLEEGQKWMPVDAEQYFTVEEPGFVWHAKVLPAPFVWFEGQDSYYRGEGRLFFKLFSTVTVADEAGEDISKGELVRYLTEAVWFPTALLPENGNIEWHPVDSDRARIVLKDSGYEISALCFFNEQGEITRMETMDRPKNGEEKVKFVTTYTNYQEVNGGVKIPVEGIAQWEYEDRIFPYFRGRITGIQYNTPEQY